MSQDLKEIVKKINDSFTQNNIEGFLEHSDENIVWRMAGDKSYTGKQSVRDFVAQMEGHEPPQFTTDILVAEGNTVVCSGEMTMKEKDGAVGHYSYCDIYTFKGDKVAELSSFVVKAKSEAEDQPEASKKSA